MAGDPFDTAGLRRRVLDAWAASPERFREDANAEEDLALGGYRDRLIVELAQNAADAATRAGTPGSLRLRLADGVLCAANTGAPLDVAGVKALSSLRASAKRDGSTVGRFGVGFAAVLAVTDEPEIRSMAGGVRFSAAETRKEVAGLPALAGELARRGGAVPVLRLPRPLHGRPPAGFTTEVRLPLRDTAVEIVRTALDSLDASLLLALPNLSKVEVDGRVITRSGGEPHVVISDNHQVTRWRVVRAEGEVPPQLLAGRPTEERERSGWTVLWAIPETGLVGRQVVYAPTPSDEPLSLPARLVASFPLGPDRRHVAPGALTDWLIQRCAETYLMLVQALDTDPEVLDLVPAPGIAAGELDAALCAAVLNRMRAAAWLPGGIVPSAARVLGLGLEDAVPLLRDVIPNLLPADWSGRRAQRPLQALGVRRLPVADVVEAVAGLRRPPEWWRRLYAALADVPDREALGALPVPLTDGRLVSGPRGVLLPGQDLPAVDLSVLDVRLAHPDAVHLLLERLGGTPASARSVLVGERVRAQVEQAFDNDQEPAGPDSAAEPGARLAGAVLALVAAAGIQPGELPWLAELPLPAQDGQRYPAGELLMPGSPLAAVMAADSPFEVVEPELCRQWGAAALEAIGVLSTFAVLRANEVDAAEHSLDGEQDYLSEVLAGEPGMLEELVAVRDLELVDPRAWPRALALLAAEPLRSAVAATAVVVPGGRRVPSYTSWWLCRHPVLGGARPRDLRLAGVEELAGLYDLAAGPDVEFLRLIGCRTGLDDVLADDEGARSLLARLADTDRTCSPSTLRQVYTRLAGVLSDIDPPRLVRVAPDRVLPTDRVVVLDVPYALPLLGSLVAIPGGSAVADLLDLPMASEILAGPVTGDVLRTVGWSDIPGARLAAERLGGRLPDACVVVHGALTVSDVPVDWWPEGSSDHLAEESGAAGLGRALAWRMRRWDLRAAAVEALAAPGYETLLRAEDAAAST